MVRKPIVEILVGLFMIVGAIALGTLAFQVSGLAHFHASDYYMVTAEFDNIGNLKARAPVSIGGVKVGEVANIMLDPGTFRAKAILYINDKNKNIPTDSSASILTQGLLGSNYVSLTPGFDDTSLKNGDTIQNTRSAIILENLIGQLLFSVKNGGTDDKTTAN